jgi:hypothetical protein
MIVSNDGRPADQPGAFFVPCRNFTQRGDNSIRRQLGKAARLG